MARYLILTCVKNEAPFLLEWVAHHRAIGFTDFLIYSNDSDDGTDEILGRLAEMGVLEVRDNRRREGQRPSHQARAFRKAVHEPAYRSADWVAVIDADEFVNVHVGDGRISDLVAAAGEANTISLAWRLFGHAGEVGYRPGLLTERLTRAAPHFCPRPAQAWGMKTLFRPETWARLGVHRPRAPVDDDWSGVVWVNGSGRRMGPEFNAGNWRFDRATYGYDLAQVNHYALRSRHSFLLKQLRGRAFGGQALDLRYWRRMDRNEDEDVSIAARLPATRSEFDRLLADDILRARHEDACALHEDRIAEVLRGADAQRVLARIDRAGAAP